MKTLLALALMMQTAITPPPPKFDSGRAWEHLRQLVAIGPRPSGSPAIEQTRKYIKDQLTAAGVAFTDQTWDDETPLGKVRMSNLIATIPGARRDRLVIAGHYDTKLFRQFRFVGASGRRVERRVPARARPRPQDPPQSADHRAPVSRRRGSGRQNGRATITPTAAATMSTRRRRTDRSPR